MRQKTVKTEVAEAGCEHVKWIVLPRCTLCCAFSGHIQHVTWIVLPRCTLCCAFSGHIQITATHLSFINSVVCTDRLPALQWKYLKTKRWKSTVTFLFILICLASYICGFYKSQCRTRDTSSYTVDMLLRCELDLIVSGYERLCVYSVQPSQNGKGYVDANWT
jgi:hypothetical protein